MDDEGNKDQEILRYGIETAVRMLSVADRTEVWADTRGDLDEQYFHLDVFKRDESVIPPELPPFKQLALSVLVGEPIPPAVLLSALEDAGVFSNGVLAAKEEAENAPLDMGAPVYDPYEMWQAGDDRFNGEFRGWFRGQQAHVFGLCKGVFGRGNAGVGNLFSHFLHEWIGHRRPADPLPITQWPTTWPTNDYIRQRIAALPPMPRVLRHLRTTASPTTAALLTRLIDHLERR